MRDSTKKIIVTLNFLIVLSLFFINVYKQENIKLKDERIILRLAPVDPRSLMQGDYMILNYDIVDMLYQYDINKEKYEKGGYIILKENKDGVSEIKKISEIWHERSIKFLKIGNKYSIEADSYFFQEGESIKYDNARYVKLIPYDKGKVRIECLLDEQFKEIR